MSFAEMVRSGRTERAPDFLNIRFDASGKALRDPGTTVVAHLKDAPGAEAVVRFGAALGQGSMGRCFAMLPVPSYHMTVFNGLLTHDRSAPFWPGSLSPSVSAEEADRWMLDRLALLRGVPAPLGMAMRGITASETGGIGLTLEPVDGAEDA
ncbi:MAG: DUF1868 domain-containing protein, partial [Pseudomonadota bacterium]